MPFYTNILIQIQKYNTFSMNYKINFIAHNYTFTKTNLQICLFISIFYNSISQIFGLLFYICLFIYPNFCMLIDM